MTSSLDHLQEQGYEPQEPGTRGEDWYDLVISGTGTIRVCVSGDGTQVHVFDRHMACEASSGLSPGTPGSVVLAVLGALEDEMARRRGGPVTPAQEAKAR